ncbi:MAG: hypothetical protein IT450_07880 [Phycisphaerales bacterium]|nr:hypothetical protein [Phycisphaerales bacterium]
MAVGVHACTDVTGFGLIGHAFEMAEASGVTIEIEASAVPLMARVLEFARQGVLTRAHKTARAYLGSKLRVAPDVEEALAGVLLDAQTSGGLLLSVASEKLSALLDALQSMKAICAAAIGGVAAFDGTLRVHLTK